MPELETLLDTAMEPNIAGISFVMIGVWMFIGVIAGGLLPGRRPLGMLGSMIGGVIGALGAGYVVDQFPKLNPAGYISGLPTNITEMVGALIAALVGALIVLILLRLFVRK